MTVQRLLDGFERAAAASPVLRFVDVALRGIGQVMFQDNPLTGLFFLAAILWGAVAGGAPMIAVSGILAVVVATAVAPLFGVEDGTWRAGIFGFNAVLTGLALATFLEPGVLLIAFVVLGAALSVVVTQATARLLAPYGVPALTFPFVLTTWLLLLASHGLAGVNAAALPEGRLVAPAMIAAADLSHPIAYLGGVVRSIGQVFLKDSIVAALLFLVGLAVNSLAACGLAIAGAVIAVAVAHVFGAESDLVTGGLLGFSPVLTAVALGCAFLKPSRGVLAYAAFGTVASVVVQVALNAALAPFALPAMTMPFVLVTWLFLLPRLGRDG